MKFLSTITYLTFIFFGFTVLAKPDTLENENTQKNENPLIFVPSITCKFEEDKDKELTVIEKINICIAKNHSWLKV